MDTPFYYSRSSCRKSDSDRSHSTTNNYRKMDKKWTKCQANLKFNPRLSLILSSFSLLSPFIFFLVSLAFLSQAASGQELIVRQGSNVSIPCGQPEQNFSDIFIIWKKNGETLAMIAKGGKILTSKAQIIDGKDIFITNASKSDMAQYECVANTRPPQIFTIMLEVHYPPTIDIEPDLEEIVVKKGDNLTIVCNADGNPTPEIIWTKDGGEVKSQNVKINFDTLSWQGPGVGEDAAGTYECLAANGELPNARKSVKVILQSLPELEVMSYVNGEPGETLKLTCKFRGLPMVKVSWFQDGKLITPSTEKSLLQEPDENANVLVSLLVLHKLTDKDFESVFTCVGINDLGNASTNLTIKRIPESVIIDGISDEINGDTNTALITFYSLSHTPIYEFKMTLIDTHNKRFVKEITITADKQSYNHTKTYKLPGLRSNAEYEVKIRAKNQYGWSEGSKGQSFFTNSFKEPSMRSAQASPTSAATSHFPQFTTTLLRATTIALLIYATIFYASHC